MESFDAAPPTIVSRALIHAEQRQERHRLKCVTRGSLNQRIVPGSLDPVKNAFGRGGLHRHAV
jgi:hypothetical protein